MIVVGAGIAKTLTSLGIGIFYSASAIGLVVYWSSHQKREDESNQLQTAYIFHRVTLKGNNFMAIVP